MYIFIEPVTEEQVETIQKAQKEKVEEYERSVLGLRPKEDNDKENSKGWNSIMPRVKDEIRNDKIELDERAMPALVGSTSSLLSETLSNDGLSNQSSEPRAYAEDDTEFKPSLAHDEDVPNDIQEEDGSKVSQGDSASSEPTEESELKPILALTLTIRSKVNGKYQQRPTGLRAEDEWNIEYSITEIGSLERAWKLYEMCKQRRKNVLPQDNVDDENNYFRRVIREYSESGREWRAKMDEYESQQQRVIFQARETSFEVDARPSPEGPKSLDDGPHEPESIDGVDDYLHWMYEGGKI